MIATLTWISLITGGLLVLLLLLSLVGGLDLDVDVGSTDVDSGGGGLGLVKGGLTFLSVGSWVAKILMAGQDQPFIAAAVGVVAGLAAFALLHYLLKVLMRNESNVNWEITDALFQEGTTYLKIPAKGTGIVRVNIKGSMRELEAKTSGEDIPTGTAIRVVDTDGKYAVVVPSDSF